MTKKREITFTLVRGLVAIGIALLVATILIFISSTGASFSDKLASTGEALKQLLIGPLFKTTKTGGIAFDAKRFCNILALTIPIIFTGLSVCIMFAANQFNMGAEGGIMLGAFVSAMVAIYLPMPYGLHALVAVIIGGLAVALTMLIPAILKVKLDVSEMVCSLMLNYIIMYLIKFFMNTYLADKSKGQIMSYPFKDTANIAPILNNTVFTDFKTPLFNLSIMELVDAIGSKFILPLGCLIFSVFTTSNLGWGFDNYLLECNSGEGIKFSAKLKPYFKFVLPIIIFLISVFSIIYS